MKFEDLSKEAKAIALDAERLSQAELFSCYHGQDTIKIIEEFCSHFYLRLYHYSFDWSDAASSTFKLIDTDTQGDYVEYASYSRHEAKLRREELQDQLDADKHNPDYSKQLDIFEDEMQCIKGNIEEYLLKTEDLFEFLEDCLRDGLKAGIDEGHSLIDSITLAIEQLLKETEDEYVYLMSNEVLEDRIFCDNKEFCQCGNLL